MARRSAGFRELSTPIFSHEVFKATGQGTSETRNHCDPKPLTWWGRQNFDLRPRTYKNDPVLLPRMERAPTRPQRPPSIGPILHFPAVNTVVGIMGRLTAR